MAFSEAQAGGIWLWPEDAAPPAPGPFHVIVLAPQALRPSFYRVTAFESPRVVALGDDRRAIKL